jgi:hypothetical protein
MCEPQIARRRLVTHHRSLPVGTRLRLTASKSLLRRGLRARIWHEPAAALTTSRLVLFNEEERSQQRALAY